MAITDVRASAIAAELDTHLVGSDRVVTGMSPLADVGRDQLTFVVDVDKRRAEVSRALDVGAVVIAPLSAELEPRAPGALIAVDNPRAAFAVAVTAFFAPRVQPGVHPTAIIADDAQVHPTAYIGEYSVIRAGVVIEEGVEVRAHVVIHQGARIGAHSLIKSHAVVGEEGFGMEKDAEGNNLRIPHVGSVRLGRNVEIGNFTTVCSGTISPTIVGDYTKIDDHVHIAHNCRIGRNVIITACAEVSGSVVIEDDTWIGPNAAIIQGVVLGERSLLGIGAVAVKSIPSNEVQIGNPARRFRDNS